MGFENNFIKTPENKKRETKKEEYEKLLWEKTELIHESKQELKRESIAVFEEIRKMNSGNLNLHQMTELKKKEDRYWQIEKEIKMLEEEEIRIEGLLDDLQSGNIDESKIKELIKGLDTENKEHISKRKQRILEERARLGEDIIDIDYGPGGRPQVAHPTTGRNLKSVKMNMDSFSAAGEFFYRTADTHGGKVDAGKDGNQYASKSGKMIRKK